MIVVVMGPAGSGKTTVGSALAKALGWDFRDADEFHPPANIEKMGQGIPLTDADRAPWLSAMHDAILQSASTKTNLILACSALKHEHRNSLTAGAESDVRFVYLKASRELLEERLKGRTGHFMKVSMLASQLQVFEEPDESEAIILDASQAVEELVTTAQKKLVRH